MPRFKRVNEKALGEILLSLNILTDEQLKTALEKQEEEGGVIGQVLVEMGYAKEEDIAQALTVQYGFPYLPLENYDLNIEAVKIIPEAVARQYNLIAIDKIGDTLTIAMANPLDEQAINDIEELTNTHVQSFVSTLSSITRAIEKYYKHI